MRENTSPRETGEVARRVDGGKQQTHVREARPHPGFAGEELGSGVGPRPMEAQRPGVVGLPHGDRAVFDV